MSRRPAHGGLSEKISIQVWRIRQKSQICIISTITVSYKSENLNGAKHSPRSANNYFLLRPDGGYQNSLIFWKCAYGAKHSPWRRKWKMVPSTLLGDKNQNSEDPHFVPFFYIVVQSLLLICPICFKINMVRSTLLRYWFWKTSCLTHGCGTGLVFIEIIMWTIHFGKFCSNL